MMRSRKLQFRMLGPLEIVTDDGQVRHLRSPTQRSLLALLLIHRNNVLSSGQIIDEIWGDDESRPEPKSLQFHVSKLRDALDPDRPRGNDGGLIVTKPSGYMLEATDDQVDSAVFENLVGDRDHTAMTPPARRRELLEQALSMWRGPVLEDLPDLGAARIEAGRLTAMRLNAIEDRIDADLALGRHAAGAAELEVLIDQYPLRERLRGQLMLALYRADRQAESLQVFQATRECLIAELGLEPSPALRQLESQILRQDEALDLVLDVDPPRTNIPSNISSFIGREEEMATLRQLVGHHRLVTLTGIGGVGKTRHATRLAADPDVQPADGAWIAEFGRLQDAAGVPQALRSALGVPLRPGASVLDALIEDLRTRDILLVLDNCEHVVDAVAELVQRLISSCPDLHVIATSREPLRVAGEVTWAVPPLRLADSDELVDRENLPESVALFVDRARSANPDFELTTANLETVNTLCCRLDGLPLAIELAASRVRAFSIGDLAARLEDRFSLLSSRVRSSLPHQQTLESTVAWSYDLLAADERALFECIGIFAGSFDLESVEEVGRSADLASNRIADLLAELVDKSLLTVDSDGDDARYRMLETIREYASLRLAERPTRQAVEDAHTRWAVAFAVEANIHLMGPTRDIWLSRIYENFGDLLVVLERSHRSADPATGLRLLTAMEHFLIEIGDHQGFLTTTAVEDGASWLERLLDTGHVEAGTLASVLSMRGFLLMLQGDDAAARIALERSIELSESAGDGSGRAHAQLYLATAIWEETERARQLLTSAVNELSTVDTSAWQYWMSLYLLNLWDLQHGDPSDAEPFARTLVTLGDESGDAITRAHGSEVLGLRAHFAGFPDIARSELFEAVSAYRHTGFGVSCFAHCLDHISLWTLEQGDARRAAILLGAAEALRGDHVGAPAPAAEKFWHDQAKTAAKSQLGEKLFDRRFHDGHQTEPSQAGDLASAILLAPL